MQRFEIVYGSHLQEPIQIASFETKKEADDYYNEMIQKVFEYELANYWVREVEE